MLTDLSPGNILQDIRTKEWQKTAKSNAKKPNDCLVMDDSTKTERRSIMV